MTGDLIKIQLRDGTQYSLRNIPDSFKKVVIVNGAREKIMTFRSFMFTARRYQDVLVVNTVIIRIMEYSVCKVKGNGSEMVHCLLCRLL